MKAQQTPAIIHAVHVIAIMVGAAVSAAPAVAGMCIVPGSHASIQAAIDDPGCNDIQLSNQSYFEFIDIDRSLLLSGPPGGTAEVIGQVIVSGSGTVTTLSEFRIESGCAEGAVRVTGGAQMTGAAMRIAHNASTPCLMGQIFRDGFEG